MITDDLREIGWSVADLVEAALSIASGEPVQGRVLELCRAGWTIGQILDALRSTTRLLSIADERELRRLIDASAPQIVRRAAQHVRQAAGTDDEPACRRVLEMYGFRSAVEVDRLTDDEIRLAVAAAVGAGRA